MSTAYNATQREWLRDFHRWAAGDPALSADEALFVTRMGRLGADDDERVPTREEADRVRALADRLGYDTDEPVRLPPEPTGDDLWPCPDDVWL